MSDFSFKDFGIIVESVSLQGDKIKISKVLNKPIKIHKYKIGPSKFCEKGNGKCLHIQIEIDNEMRVVFTGSINLQEMIEKVPKDKFPFNTTIVKNDERYDLT